MRNLFFLLLIVGCSVFIGGCNKAPENRVVLYCSVDDVYARPIVAELEKQTGLQIEALYDVEAAKTAGLANRIRAEKNRPRGDVFWSSALLQTLLLQREGLLQEYSSPEAKDIPAAFKDKNGAWAGMGLRSRVLMVRGGTAIGTAPDADVLLHHRWKGKIGISNPQFGTASDWAAALAVRGGKQKTLEYFRALKKNGVQVLPGNGVVAEKIIRGELVGGVTDSDDYLVFTRKSKTSFFGLPFHPSGRPESEAVLIPGSVAMLKNAPHAANARKLVDALVSRATENRLARQMPGVLATREYDENTKRWSSAGAHALFPSPLHTKFPDDTARWADAWLEIRDPLFEILLTP